MMKKEKKKINESKEDIQNISNEEISPKKEDPLKSSNKMRQIIIETDGDNIRLVKSEVAGNIELVGIFQRLIEYINTKRPQ